MHDARHSSKIGQITSQAFQAFAKNEAGMVAPAVGVIGNLPAIASQAGRPWFNSLAGQIIQLAPDDIEKIGIKKPDFEDRFVVDNAQEIAELVSFGVGQSLINEPLVKNLVIAPMGTHRQGESCAKVFSEILTSVRYDVLAFQEKVIKSLDFNDERRIVFNDFWSWAESSFNYTVSICDTDSHDSERSRLGLRIDNEIGGSLTVLNVSNLTGSFSHLGKAVCCFASMLCEMGFKGNTISLLEDGYPYSDFSEIVDDISEEDQKAVASMHDSVGNYDLEGIEKFITDNYPDVANDCDETVGGEWGYSLVECIEARIDLRGDWRQDFDVKKGVIKNLDSIERLLKDWKRSSITNEHPVYDFMVKALSVFRDNFNVSAEHAACWDHGCDQILSSKFIGFGVDQEEHLMGFVNENSWNEDVESIILTMDKPELILPFLSNIALSEIMLIALAAVFEKI